MSVVAAVSTLEKPRKRLSDPRSVLESLMHLLRLAYLFQAIRSTLAYPKERWMPMSRLQQCRRREGLSAPLGYDSRLQM